MEIPNKAPRSRQGTALCIRAEFPLRAGLRALFAPVIAAGILCGACAYMAPEPTISQMEHAHPGAAAIKLTNSGTDHEIEGYASAPSVNRGEDIRLYVNTIDPGYTMEIFRMGWYDGAGSRLMLGPIALQGMRQSAPTVADVDTNLVEADWRNPYILHIPNSTPTDWPSGVYIAMLTGSVSGKQSYIILVVRDDNRRSDLLFQCSVNTWQAYNKWGGHSLYTKHPRAYKVSFNRPYGRGHGTGDFLFWEYPMVRFLEREGYDVTYTTDVDTHQRGDLLFSHKAVLIVGHDEYWSWEMRDNLEAAGNGGVSLGFFGANLGYWQVRYEPSPLTGEPDRTLVGYKVAGRDPFFHNPDPNLRRRTTVQFRKPPVNRPEDALIGVMYDKANVFDDIVVEDASNWVFDGTNLQSGEHLPGLLGYEVDRMFGNAPQSTHRIAHSPYQAHGHSGFADMTVYENDSGSIVFATGTMQWNWGLVDYRVRGREFRNSAVQQATRNILARFGATPSTPHTEAEQ